MTDFFRFPHTPHLAWLGKDTPRDDKVLSAAEAAAFLTHAVVLEEKVDGANLGFSVGDDGKVRAQNRGQYLMRPFKGQFSRLNGWLAMHEETMLEVLGDHLMLFGEWVAAVHSIEYSDLPDCFLPFDVYDKKVERFLSTIRRNALLSRLGLRQIHQVGFGNFQLTELKELLFKVPSAYRIGSCEGIYLRSDDSDWLRARAKLVHPDFNQSIADHWRTKIIRWNLDLAPEKRTA